MPHANFGKLTSRSLWMDALVVLVGFALPEVLRRALESETTDLPNEVYGVAVAAGSFAVLSGRTANRAALGGGLYTLAKLLERFNLIEPVAIRVVR